MEATRLLIRRLKERQGGRSQNEFADFLGISRPMLSRLFNEEREVGMETLTRIGEKYPDLAFLFLSERVSLVHSPGEDEQPLLESIRTDADGE